MKRQPAAAYLARKITSRDARGWEQWLRDNANMSKAAAFRIPTIKIGREVFYDRAELDAFCSFENARMAGGFSSRAMEALHAVGFGQPGGSSTGRKLEVTKIAEQRDDATGNAFVQMILANPLLIYRLSPEQAIEVGEQLITEGQLAKEHADGY